MAVNIYTTGATGHGKTTLSAAIMYCLGTEYASLNGGGANGADASGVARESYATPAHQYSHTDAPASGCDAMLASSPKMDIALLVIDAASGPVKETLDAIGKAKAAGVQNLVGFLSKSDTVPDPELLELVEMEIREMTSKQGYEGDFVAIVSGSATDALTSTGARSDAKAAAIFSLIDEIDKAVPQSVH